MSRSGHIRKQWAFKGLFLMVGLMLFTAQVSYKFYYSASMPVYRASAGRHANVRGISGTDSSTATLSLDKRFDLKPSFAVLTPVFRFLPYTGISITAPCYIIPVPVDNTPVLIALRGPPSLHIPSLN